VSEKQLHKFVIREIEHSWREKMPVTHGDQLIVVVDLKLMKETPEKLKDFLCYELPSLYPEMLHQLIFVNTPPHIKQLLAKVPLPKATVKKITILEDAAISKIV